ncbi:hypothetical protein FK220_011980 [Flavobacteriaceae bacterium TP-CH-4]|uniref:Uncharacterized protein n=1 Tax=Pelagihabitans pacificus TaxID=2696054 RepID=A0A967ATF4_9FLAO|nr:hypothetical protein [Pelagihabitans pacificus]NHF60066.1 hypothetical protein [Pelagihabitans pacificus]
MMIQRSKNLVPLLSIIFVCFTSCVQETHLKTVTFKVDATAIDSITAVGIKGNFTSPPWDRIIPMSDEEQDGIYELKVTRKTADHQAEFKFVDQNGIYELKGQGNRVLHFKYEPERLTYIARFNDPHGEQIKQ